MALTATIQYTNNPCFGMDIGSATVVASGGLEPYEYLWDDAAGSTTASISGLGAGTYNVQVADSTPTVISLSVTITEPDQTEPYIFGSECEFQCFLMQMSCCQADQVYKLITNDRAGISDKDCHRKALLMEEYLSILQCWHREGDLIQEGRNAIYIILVKPYFNLDIVTFTLLETQVLNYTFNTGLTRDQNMTAIINQLASNGLAATYTSWTDQGSGDLWSQLIVEAPQAGSGYNCIEMVIECTNKDGVTAITSGFIQGQDEIVAGPPCLSEEQVQDMIEQMKCICGCTDCNNLAKLTSDQIN